MKLEDQVCTEAQANKLKELGVAQKSIFYYHALFERPVFGETVVTEFGKQYKKAQVRNDKKAAASAFTVAELGMILPAEIKECKLVQWPIHYTSGTKSYGIQYRYKCDSPVTNQAIPDHCVFGHTEAEVRASLLIELLESKVITAEEANKRLTES